MNFILSWFVFCFRSVTNCAMRLSELMNWRQRIRVFIVWSYKFPTWSPLCLAQTLPYRIKIYYLYTAHSVINHFPSFSFISSFYFFFHRLWLRFEFLLKDLSFYAKSRKKNYHWFDMYLCHWISITRRRSSSETENEILIGNRQNVFFFYVSWMFIE